MIDTILNNLQMIGYAMILLAGAWLSNTILGLYDNLMIKDMAFDKNKLKSGILRLVALCLGTALVSIVISVFPEYLTKYGIDISGEITDTFSVLIIASMYAIAIAKYLKEAIAKLGDLLR